ncbi:MAG TPA: methylamine utilization MauE [Elusimicrobia bacterium]|nr:methylamine utilization MauE [Elusimicrobiota bacterium]
MNSGNRVLDILGLLARLAVGGMFVYAGTVKLLAPAEEFAYAIETYKVTGAQLSLWAAYIMPWLELYAGLLLAAGIFTRLNAALCGALLLFFEALLAQARLRGLPVTSCGCFGSGSSNSLEYEFFQNLVFLALVYAAYRYGRNFSVESAIRTTKDDNDGKETT